MPHITAKGIWQVFKDAGAGFSKDKVPKLSASLAYYTVFSLGPMLLIIIFLANLFWGKAAVEGSIYEQIRGFVGDAPARQIQEIIKNASVDSNSTLTAVIGFTTLFIGATTVFSEMQDSLNTIWRLKVKTDRNWLKLLLTRLTSFSLVIGLGFILLVSLIINALLEGFMNDLEKMFPDIGFVIIYVINLLLTLIVISFLFAIIFKVLPDALIKWRDVAVGAIFTALLFMIGKFGITLYIGSSNVSSSYGAAGSLVVLLLWVYFSSTILYFGAEFTKAYSMKYGSEIRPNDYTVTVQTVSIESDEKSIQENEKKARAFEEKTKKEQKKSKKQSETARS